MKEKRYKNIIVDRKKIVQTPLTIFLVVCNQALKALYQTIFGIITSKFKVAKLDYPETRDPIHFRL